MTDAEFIFKQTSSERKRIARGDYNKKRQGGKTIRFPSDHLSRKEKAELNGEVKTYSFIKPLYWEEFKEMPKDIQQNYIDTLQEKFNGVSGPTVAESLGVGYSTFRSYLVRLGLEFKRKKGERPRINSFMESEDGKAWVKWHETYRKESAVEEVAEESVADEVKEEPEIKEEFVKEVVHEPVKIENSDSIEDFILALASLRGTGAKITIELTL